MKIVHSKVGIKSEAVFKKDSLRQAVTDHLMDQGGIGPLKTVDGIQAMKPHATNVVRQTMRPGNADIKNSLSAIIVAFLVINLDGALTNRNSAMLPPHLNLFLFLIDILL